MEQDHQPIEILLALHRWLAAHQIRIEQIQLQKLNNKFAISFLHPVKGEILVTLPSNKERYVQLSGIGFVIDYSPDGSPKNVTCFDNGGIFDPVENRVPGDHYGASHFALICSVLYKISPSDLFLEQINRALEFQQQIAKGNLFSSWAPHWEFDNFAWSEVYLLLNGIESTVLLTQKIGEFLEKAPQHKLPFATNWKLLAICYLFNYRHKKIANRILSYFRIIVYLFFINQSILADGCIEDIPGASRSIQYHAFSSALIGRLYDLMPRKNIGNVIIKAAEYLSSFVSPDSDINYKGRGQRQIFGYISCIYVFLMAGDLLKSPESKEKMRINARLVYKYLVKHQNIDGSFDLVLNDLGDAGKIGWSSYHHKSVYNAMVGAWLGLALVRFPSFRGLCNERKNEIEKKNNTHFHKASKVYVGRIGNVFLCVSAGENYYETDCGLAPHLIYFKGWGPLITCPGGPSGAEFGSYRTELMNYNFYAPLLLDHGVIIGPGNKVSSNFDVSKAKNKICISMTYSPNIQVEREITIQENTLRILDGITILEPGNKSTQLIGVNLPILQDNEMDYHLDGSRLFFHKQGVKVEFNFSSSGTKEHYLISVKQGNTAAGRIQLFQSNPISFSASQTIFFHHRWNIFN